MNADLLLKAIIEYGADVDGIEDRFGDNVELYAGCVQEFVDSPSMSVLGSALIEKDYSRAFDTAHSLKGVSGNLGLTAYYQTISALVESLREKSYGNLTEEYAAVRHEYNNVCLINAGESPRAYVPDAADSKSAGPLLSKMKKVTWLNDWFVAAAVASIFAVFVIFLTAAFIMSSNYRSKVRLESGQHLLETGSQIGMYTQSQISNDWQIVDSIGRSITDSNYLDDDSAFMKILKTRQEAWDVNSLILYTENGAGIDTDGNAVANGSASMSIAQAKERGSLLSIVDSRIIYTLPLETEQTFRGSKIAAVSVVRNLDTFLSELEISSFNDSALIILTDVNGVIISYLSSDDAFLAYNIKNIVDDYSVSALGSDKVHGDIFSNAAAAFYLAKSSVKAGDMYLVSVPINAWSKTEVDMRVFYMVPETAVNSSSNEFANQLTIFSLTLVTILVLLAAMAFMAKYRSRKKKLDAALSSREQMFDLLIQNIRAVFGLFDAESGEPRYISANVAKVLGDERWMLQKTQNGYRARAGSGRDSAMLRQVNELLLNWDGKSVFRSGYLCRSETVPPAYFELILYPVGDAGKELVGILQDVSITHEREEATKNAMEMAERSNEAKTRFLANMSHDIRTPMNAIINMTRFAMESGTEPRKHAEYLKIIYEASQHLLHLINDVLDMSRIDSGQVKLAAEPFDLKAEMCKQADTVKALCDAKRQTFIVDLDGIRTKAVLGDSLKVAQVVSNLLSNASKFTPDGGAIRFTVTEIPSLRDEIVNVRFTVEDTGIGISQEYQQKIFDPFSRADDKRVVKIEGTGLGLAIVKSYVDAMGGSIECFSEKGEGSIFTVELFFQQSSPDKVSRSAVDVFSNTPFTDMRCLVAEDIATNQVIAKTLLERLGFTVELAGDGKEAVRKFLRSPPDTYDAIYMDIQMPLMDGYQATAFIRHSEHPQAKTIPIIAMSAYVFVEDVEKARIAGMDGYIGKPVVSIDMVEQTLKALQIKKGSF